MAIAACFTAARHGHGIARATPRHVRKALISRCSSLDDHRLGLSAHPREQGHINVLRQRLQHTLRLLSVLRRDSWHADQPIDCFQAREWLLRAGVAAPEVQVFVRFLHRCGVIHLALLSNIATGA